MRASSSAKSSGASRKPHKKVKTGCKTCRIRRVKCDEERPSCFKCTSTGRKCDGYTQNHIPCHDQDITYTQIKSLWPSRALAALPGFGEDMHYLEFYYYCVGPKLSGRFDIDFWSRTILQMAHSEHAVRSALIALSDLDQHQSGSLQHARRSVIGQKHYSHRSFWLKYNKAIRLLVEQMAKPAFPAEVGLVVCLLFACIEFLQADAKIAFTHIRSGLNIVHELRRRKKANTPVGSAELVVGARSEMVEQTLVPILTQALASALPYGASLTEDFVFLESCPQYFTGELFLSVTDARSSYFDLRNSAFMIARDMAIKMYQSKPFNQSDQERQRDLLRRHHIWMQALEAFESSHLMQSEDVLSISALKLGYYASYSACACIMDKTQLSYDAHLHSFRCLIRHASVLIRSHQIDPPRQRIATANFTFDTSVIPALFYTAIRCRCPQTRREAINLLGKDLPREGLWDPEQHRIVAERVVEIEEMDVDPNGWPTEASRLCKSSVGTDVDAKNGFQASFLYTTDLAKATKKTWHERHFLAEGREDAATLGPYEAASPHSSMGGPYSCGA